MAKRNRFTILMTGYNVRPFVERSLSSALSQNYEESDVIYVDALSDDSSLEYVLEQEKQSDRLRVLTSDTRTCVAENYVRAMPLIEHDRIVVNLDADDHLLHENVLSTLDEVYKPEVWVTYGSFLRFKRGQLLDERSEQQAYTQEEITQNKFRQSRWKAGHLRTFRRALFDHFDADTYLKDSEGQYFDVSGDVAIMLPLLELAGVHSRFIPDALYAYNYDNPLSDHRINQQRYHPCLTQIRALPPLSPLPTDSLNT